MYLFSLIILNSYSQTGLPVVTNIALFDGHCLIWIPIIITVKLYTLNIHYDDSLQVTSAVFADTFVINLNCIFYLCIYIYICLSFMVIPKMLHSVSQILWFIFEFRPLKETKVVVFKHLVICNFVISLNLINCLYRYY